MSKKKPSINDSGLDWHHLQHLFFLNIGLAAAMFVSTVVSNEGSSTAGLIFGGVSLAIGYATFQLSAAWTVLGPGLLLQRLAFGVGACSVVGLGLLFGILISPGISRFDNGFGRAMASFAGWCSIHWLIAQIPFWLGRFTFRWRFATHQDYQPTALTIADMLLFTAVVAASFSITRQFTDETDTAAIMIFVVGFPLVGYVLFTLPGLVLLLRGKGKDTGCILYFGVCAAVFGIGVFVFSSLAVPSEYAFLFIGSFTASLGFIIGLSCQIAHNTGVRLYSGKEKQ